MKKSFLNVGFDIDGTLSYERFDEIHRKMGGSYDCTTLNIMRTFRPTKYMDLLILLENLGHKIFVISFRRESWKDLTLDWMKEKGASCKINYNFCPPEYYTDDPSVYERVAPVWKSEVINKNNLDLYFEDSEFLVNKLESLCPYTTIVKV